MGRAAAKLEAGSDHRDLRQWPPRPKALTASDETGMIPQQSAKGTSNVDVYKKILKKMEEKDFKNVETIFSKFKD